jgi:hypothetical protein
LCVLVFDSLFFTRPASRFQASVSGVTVSGFKVIIFRGPLVSIAVNIYIQRLKGGLLCYIQTQEHPGRKARGNTRRGASRAVAGTTVTGGVVAACAHRHAFRAPSCRNLKNLAVGVFVKT